MIPVFQVSINADHYLNGAADHLSLYAYHTVPIMYLYIKSIKDLLKVGECVLFFVQPPNRKNL